MDYQMNCCFIGGVTSPSCINYALKKTAVDNEPKLENETDNTLKKKFYVNSIVSFKCT